ncbi:hypothetical protein N9863_00775 [Flavobacteriaceae bacterium]|nr:hypothetical protein [Flavobacteriaceae bacterium]
MSTPVIATIKTAINIPETSKKRWNNKILTTIGASKIRANGTHFLNSSSPPISNSKQATTYKTYPVLFKDSIKFAAAGAMSKIGMKAKNLFMPNISKETPSNMRKIVVKVEFIMMIGLALLLLKDNKK